LAFFTRAETTVPVKANAQTSRNGFLTLAEFDRPENGGNGDGLIRKDDAIFNSLRLWQDSNKNGVSEASELHMLKELGFKTIELEFKESRRVDGHGISLSTELKLKTIGMLSSGDGLGMSSFSQPESKSETLVSSVRFVSVALVKEPWPCVSSPYYFLVVPRCFVVVHKSWTTRTLVNR
jgi:hypothetical protein